MNDASDRVRCHGAVSAEDTHAVHWRNWVGVEHAPAHRTVSESRISRQSLKNSEKRAYVHLFIHSLTYTYINTYMHTHTYIHTYINTFTYIYTLDHSGDKEKVMNFMLRTRAYGGVWKSVCVEGRGGREGTGEGGRGGSWPRSIPPGLSRPGTTNVMMRRNTLLTRKKNKRNWTKRNDTKLLCYLLRISTSITLCHLWLYIKTPTYTTKILSTSTNNMYLHFRTYLCWIWH